jgi:hypothetical protein
VFSAGSDGFIDIIVLKTQTPINNSQLIAGTANLTGYIDSAFSPISV